MFIQFPNDLAKKCCKSISFIFGVTPPNPLLCVCMFSPFLKFLFDSLNMKFGLNYILYRAGNIDFCPNIRHFHVATSDAFVPGWK